MRTFSTALAVLGLCLPSALASTPTPQLDFGTNWATLHSGPAALVFGPGFFGFDPNISLGDSIRLCYSIDVTQGGRNEDGLWELSWVNVTQAYGPNGPVPGVAIGPVLFSAQVSDDLGDDSCFSSFFPQSGTLSQETSGFIVPGLIAGTVGMPLTLGTYWEIAFQFLGPLPSGSTTLGSDPSSPFAGTPLLAHLIYEVQGPINSAGLSPQYFIGSTSERPGLLPGSPGGVTNGLGSFGLNLFGAPPETSGAVGASRWTSLDLLGGSFTGGTIAISRPGDTEFFGGFGLTTPYLTGINSGRTGNDNADWNVSGIGDPLSSIDLRVIDGRASNEGDPGSPSFNPALVLNQPVVLFSSTPAGAMQQSPLSWDDLGGLAPPKSGSYLLPLQDTSRQGLQTVHVNLDASTVAFLSSGLTFLQPFAPQSNPLDFGVGPNAGGAAKLATSLQLGAPIPAAAGTRLGLQALGLQIDAAAGGALRVTELSNARTAVLQ